MLVHQHGHDRDQDHEEGLKARHGCTDVPCCFIFILAIAVFSAVYGWSLKRGNIGRLYHGINFRGHVCGIDDTVRNLPYLYWCASNAPDAPLTLNLAQPICVASCPGAQSGGSLPIQPDCSLVSGANGVRPYQTILLLGRYCIPDTNIYRDVAQQITGGQLAEDTTNFIESASSVPAAWPVLLGAFLLAIVLAYLNLALLRHCAEVLMYLSMVVAVLGSAGLGAYLWVNAGLLSSKLPDGHRMPQGLMHDEKVATQVLAAACWVLSVLFLSMACCFRRNISAAAACAEVACEAIFEMPSLLIAPVIKAVVKGCLLVALLFGFFMLLSTADITLGSVSNGVSRHFAFTPAQAVAVGFYVLVSLWILSFVTALYQFIVAFAVVEYYYAPFESNGEKDVGCCAVCDGVQVGLGLHSGSLALGSFLIASMMLLQKVIEGLEMANRHGANNRVVSTILCALECLVSGCRECVQFVNKNAIIDMAVTSSNFCEAGRSALGMMLRLAGSMSILNGATFVFTFFGTLSVTLACAFFTFIVSSQGTFADQTSRYHVDNPAVAMLASAVIGFLVALTFFHVFDMASDTLLYCYGMDLQSGRHASTAPELLKELVHDPGYSRGHH